MANGINQTMNDLKDRIDKAKPDEKVVVVGFGTFRKKVKPAHKGRNPQTGESIDVPEKTTVKFKPSWTWLHFLNGGERLNPLKQRGKKPAAKKEPEKAPAPAESSKPASEEKQNAPTGKKKIVVRKTT